MRLMVVLDLPADPASVPLARHVAGAALLRAGVSTDCVDELAIAAGEALSHAYRHSGRGEGFQVIMRMAEDVVSIDVLAETASMAGRSPPRRAKLPSYASLGGALMAAFTDRVAFGSTDGDIASVHLSRRVDWAHGAPLREPSSAV